MKIVFFSPYLTYKHAGGGEKHLFDTALATGQLGAQVFIAISPLDQSRSFQLTKHQKFYTEFMGKNLDTLEFITTPLMTQAGLREKLLWTKNFDQLYYVTDGSLFFSLAKKNHLHIQVPFTTGQSTLVSRLKLKNWQVKNTNSKFTQQVIEARWQTKIDFVHWPLVELDQFQPHQVKKEKLILSVGRFFKQLHSKRQDILIQAFIKLIHQNPKLMQGWRLVLVGAPEDQLWVRELKKMAKGYPVEFRHQVNRAKLIKLFQQASFYWHATGYKVNELKHPEKVEHFGITTVEAMAAKALPLVVPKGGQKEVLGKKLIKLLAWQEVDELVAKTASLIKNSPNLEADFASQIKPFSQDAFNRRVMQMFQL